MTGPSIVSQWASVTFVEKITGQNKQKKPKKPLYYITLCIDNFVAGSNFISKSFHD